MNRIKWVIALLVLLALVTLSQLLVMEFFNPEKYTTGEILMSPLGSLVTGLLLLFVILIPFFDYTKSLSVQKRIVYLVFFGLIYTALYILILFLFPTILLGKPYIKYESVVINFAVSDFHNVLKNYLFQIAVLYAYEFIEKKTDLVVEKKNLEIELNQTRLQILKSQLQPHFLFNALNSVVSVIDENKEKAQEMLVNLSHILRTTLNTNFKELVPLSKEIEYIENYLSIEKIRYEDQLEYRIDLDSVALKLKVPSLILQPLVENAIKHGFKGIQRPLQIVIEADAETKTITVKNNGSSLNTDFSNFGTKNVRERLSIYYPGNDFFRLYQEDDWIINKLRLG